MREEEADLLRAQLADARAEGDPIEIASIAGLLQRLAPDDDALHERATPDPGALQDAAEDALDALLAADEEDDPAETWDLLCALDELCAAATFARQPALVHPFAGEAARAIRAFPEVWAAHAAAATEVLRERTPRPEDPARLLWAATEASAWRGGVVPAGLGASDEVKRLAGLIQSFRLSLFRPQPALALAAAPDALPQAPRWSVLAKGAGWTLALTQDEREQPILLLDGAADAAFYRDGEPVEASGPAGLRCPASPGEWRVEVSGQTSSFRLEE